MCDREGDYGELVMQNAMVRIHEPSTSPALRMREGLLWPVKIYCLNAIGMQAFENGAG